MEDEGKAPKDPPPAEADQPEGDKPPVRGAEEEIAPTATDEAEEK